MRDARGLELVDVALALQVQAAAADVGRVDDEAERHLALHARRPQVRGRVLELEVDGLHRERQVGAAGAAARGLSTLPFETTTIGWNGGLPPSSSESFSVDAVVEDAGADAGDGLRVERVGHAEARLEDVVVGLREAARLAAEQRLHPRIAGDDEVVALVLEAVARPGRCRCSGCRR